MSAFSISQTPLEPAGVGEAHGSPGWASLTHISAADGALIMVAATSSVSLLKLAQGRGLENEHLCNCQTRKLLKLRFPTGRTNLSGLKFWKRVILETAVVFLHRCVWRRRRMQQHVSTPATSSLGSLKVAFLIRASVLHHSYHQESIKITTFPSSNV